MKISTALLGQKGALCDHVEEFERAFGHRSVEVTEALCLDHADKFIDWDWAAKHLLPAAALAKYRHLRTSALAKYRESMALVVAECRRVTDLPFNEYLRVKDLPSVEHEKERATVSAFGEYRNASHRALIERERAKAEAQTEYRRACASAFGRLADAAPDHHPAAPTSIGARS